VAGTEALDGRAMHSHFSQELQPRHQGDVQVVHYVVLKGGEAMHQDEVAEDNKSLHQSSRTRLHDSELETVSGTPIKTIQVLPK